MYDDNDIMLPEGYQEGMSLDDYNKSLEQGEPAAQAEPEPQQDTQGQSEASEAPTTAPGEAPTTAPDQQANGDTPTQSEAPTTAPETKAGEKLVFGAKLDHQDVDVELTPEELPEIWQKAQVTDRVQQRLTMAQPDIELAQRAREAARKLGYQTAEEMLDGVNSRLRSAAVEELTAEGMGKKAAEMLADMRYGKAPDAAAAPADAAGKAGQNSAPPARDFRPEIAALRAAYPETAAMVKLPDEVMDAAVRDGKPLVAAYAVWDARQKVAEAEKLRKENETLRQNAANAAAAPVKGATGGGDTNQKPLDDFLRGFEDY